MVWRHEIISSWSLTMRLRVSHLVFLSLRNPKRKTRKCYFYCCSYRDMHNAYLGSLSIINYYTNLYVFNLSTLRNFIIFSSTTKMSLKNTSVGRVINRFFLFSFDIQFETASVIFREHCFVQFSLII